jgi:glycosyltransferase involved in cell wall biosynthesis
MVSELFRTPWVISERSSEQAYPPTLKNRARMLIARAADAVISNSAAGDAFWKARTPHLPRFVIANALPLDEIEGAAAAVPPDLPLPSGDALVLFAGRFGAEKNIGTLVKALRRVVERPRTIAVLCGDGPLRSDIRQTIAAEGLGARILTPGYVEGLWPLMKRADAVVSVGLFEGRPNTVIEAMACGRPVVVSDIPAHREILDDQSAYWVDPGDASGIAQAVLHVLDDRRGAAARAAAARIRAGRWSVQQAAAEYDRVYRDILARRPSRGRRLD